MYYKHFYYTAFCHQHISLLFLLAFKLASTVQNGKPCIGLFVLSVEFDQTVKKLITIRNATFRKISSFAQCGKLSLIL